MIKITEENRNEVICAMVNEIVEYMDHSEMTQIVEDHIYDDYSSYSNEEIEKEVNERFPDLFEEEEEEDECEE